LLRTPKQHGRLAACVECLACNSTCPGYDFDGNPLAGPYVLVKLAQLHLDPRNTIDRRKQAQDLGVKACTDCPGCRCIHGIDIRRDALGLLA
jgi:succinate dehydrogenase/fumarate reductase-like Fe-S protein